MEEEKEKSKIEDNNNIEIKEITGNFKKARKIDLFKPPDLRKRKKSVMFLEAPKAFKLNNIKKTTEIIMNPNELQKKLQSEIFHSRTKKSRNKSKTDKNSTVGILPPIKTKVVNINKHYYIPIFSKFDPTAFLENVKKRPSYERIRTMENDKKIEFNKIKKKSKFSTTLCINKKLKKPENLFKEDISEIENGENGSEKEDDIKIKRNNKKNKVNKTQKIEEEKEKEKEDKKIDDNENKEVKMEMDKKEENRTEKENKDNSEKCKNNEDNMTNNRVIIYIQNKSANNEKEIEEEKKKKTSTIKKLLCCLYG